MKKNQKSEELNDIAIKHNSIVSSILRQLTQEFPDKFGKKINFKGQVGEGIIKIIGNFNIKDEIYERTAEYNGKEEKYKVIFMPLIKL